MKYAQIKYYDIANGEGVRTSLFVSGCTHKCEKCFNKEAWDFNYGKEFDEATIDEIIKSLEPDYIKGLTLLGGEPMEKVNQKALIPLLERIKKELPSKDIWCYTGYIYDIDFNEGQRAYTDSTDYFLSMIDVMVDGRFIYELYDISLRFRGSSNQRLIDVKASKKANDIVFWE